MLLLVKDSPQGKKCLPPAEKSAYREEKKLLTTQRKKSLPYGEKTAYRVVVNLPYHPHQFFRTAALVNKLSEAREKKKLDAFLAKLNEATILIIDEFGYVPYDRAGTQILFEYLSERHEDPGKVIIITTNLEFSAWANVVYDADMASALIGRLVHRCHLLLFPGGNYRLRESSINELYQSMTVRSGKEAE